MHSVHDTEPMSLTVRQLARRWNYDPGEDGRYDSGEQAIRRLIRDDKLPAFKVGRSYRIRLVDIEDYEIKGAAA